MYDIYIVVGGEQYAYSKFFGVYTLESLAKERLHEVYAPEKEILTVKLDKPVELFMP